MKNFKRLISIVFTGIFLISCVPLNVLASEVRTAKIEETTDEFAEVDFEEIALDQLMYDYDVSTYAMHQVDTLTEGEKELYFSVKEIVEKIAQNGGTTEVKITTPSALAGKEFGSAENMKTAIHDLFTKSISCLKYDYPELFYWQKKQNLYSVNYSYYDGIFKLADTINLVFEVDPEYVGANTHQVNPGKMNLAKQAIQNAKNEAAAIKDSGAEDWEKLKEIKNRICELTDYNYDALSSTYSKNDAWQLINVFDYDDQTKVVCEGYSKAFQYISDLVFTDRTNIEVYCVTGDLIQNNSNPGAHMWNIVRYNGDSYLTDVTNCDQSTTLDTLFMICEEDSNVTKNSDGSYTVTGWGGAPLTFVYGQDCIGLYGMEVLTLKNQSIESHMMEHVKTVPATCTKDGVKEHYKCSKCGKLFADAEGTTEIDASTLVLKAKGHRYGDWIVDKEPTETETGLRHKECAVCGDRIEEVLDKVPHVHKMNFIEKVEPTCTKDGVKEHYKCSKCGKLFADAEGTKEINVSTLVLKAKGHSYGDWIVDQEPTETETGLRHKECVVCGDRKEEVIGKLSHVHKPKLIEKVEPTCTKPGREAYYQCEGCKKNFKDQACTKEIKDLSTLDLAKSGHNWNKPTVKWSKDYKTCTATRVCKNNKDHVEHVTVKTTESEIVKPTGSTKGKVQYTAVFENEWQKEMDASELTKVVETPMLSGTWKSNSKGWWYEYTDGTYAKNEFKVINGSTFYLGEYGYAATGWLYLNGTYYLFDGNGYMLTGWQNLGGTYYYMDLNDGHMLTGKQKIGQETYLFASSGAMLTGWNKIGDQWYVFGESGAMLSNCWSGSYYLGSDGAMVTVPELEINGQMYYFDSNGRWIPQGWMSNSYGYWYVDGHDCVRSDFKEIGGETYYFDANGWMLTGWQKIDGKDYAFYPGGAMYKNAWCGNYYLGSDGAMLKNQKIPGENNYVDAYGKWVPQGWQGSYSSGFWYNKGTTYLTGRHDIGGQTYYFNANGWMLTGWQKIDGKDYAFYPGGAMYKNAWCGNYYLGSDGAMLKNQKIPGENNYVDAYGKWVPQGWQGNYNSGFWYNEGTTYVTGKHQIGGETYYFNANGWMLTGWQKIENQWYVFDGSGYMLHDCWYQGVYYLGSDGAMLTSQYTPDNYWVGADGRYVG